MDHDDAAGAHYDPVHRPRHYNTHASGVECIEITEHMGFCLGNAVKYLFRCGLKGPPLEDVRKARWYVARELERRLREVATTPDIESVAAVSEYPLRGVLCNLWRSARLWRSGRRHQALDALRLSLSTLDVYLRSAEGPP